METKKAPSKDLRSFSNLFTSVGFMLSLTIILTAFEWRFETDPKVDLRNLDIHPDTEVLDIPVTKLEPPKPVARPINVVETKDETEVTIDLPPIDLGTEDTDEIPAAPSIEDEATTDVPFLLVEQPAAPHGGFNAFYRFVAEKMRGKYPAVARRIGIEGMVFIEFIVEKDGKLTVVHTTKGIGGGCDELAVSVVESSPAWEPGRQRGKPVRQRMTLPVVFKLH